ncbi:MAG: neutral/alkaline non-lysosomal ceramidase N-terminal domain-containing protein [Chloroflexi bacterium]|nr:neutral/alkaline non-lysosomal ceramidase N-terminal domain-containing protein [Chloroflexota bacterium]
MEDQFMYCGAGRAEITPPVGTPMGGYANRLSPCQGVLEPLFVRVLLLKQTGAACMFITLDALAINAGRAQKLCEVAAQACGDPVTPGDVRVICSHTHSGADLSGMFGAGAQLALYFEHVTTAVHTAAQQACNSLTPATVAHGTTSLPIGKNRRLRPGHAQVTELERAQGAAIDHTLTVISLRRAGTGQPVATLFHTACHPVCLGPENTLASGDFAGIAAQSIEQQSGATALFFNGACGNITPIIGRGSSYAATRELAQQVASAVLDTRLLGEVGCLKPGCLKAAPQTLVPLPLSCRFESAADIEQAATWLLQQNTGFTSWEATVQCWQQRLLDQLVAGTLPTAVTIPLSTVRLGGVCFAFLGAEVFNEYQLWQPTNVRLASYTNGEGCYIPSAAALAGGGYEVNTAPVFYGLPCAPAADAERALLAAIREQIGLVQLASEDAD